MAFWRGRFDEAQKRKSCNQGATGAKTIDETAEEWRYKRA
jgi:hypothetical protein